MGYDMGVGKAGEHAMSQPLEEIVHFSVTITAVERDGHWAARTQETTIFGYGETREAAERSAANANLLIVTEVKKQGRDALAAYMAKYGIGYTIGSDDKTLQHPAERLTLAA